MAVSIEAIYAALPDVVGDEAALDAILRRIGRVPDHDNGKLDAMRAVAFHNRLVIQAPDGQFVKGELPKARSFMEVENERIAAMAAEERRRRDALTPDEKYVNPQRVQTEQFIQEIVGERFAALEEQVSDLQQQVEEMHSQSHEVVAA